ncbi:MAG: NUDIX hydrolase YfcD [Desulfobacteraceae bacterium]|nr:NUDIX hydrolase YfcD [Desulfobacteraceae bacterium]
MPERAIIITCEHGGHEVPTAYRQAFAAQAALLASHRGWDAGALAVASQLAQSLSRPLFATTVTRLLIDTNRSLRHPRLFSPLTAALPRTRREEIIQRHYLPHREPILAEVARLIKAGNPALHLAIHSFTPVLNGQTRRAELGLLYDSARQGEGDLCRAWQAELHRLRPDWTVRRNYPYRGKSDGLATALRAQYREEDYLGIEVEINQRRLADTAGCQEVAALLAMAIAPTPPSGQPSPDPGSERVVIVDEKNRIIGQASRREMRRDNLIHRATYILVFNRRGELFVQRRTLSKDIYPGFHDLAAGGVVQAGESYEESARRELWEELGIRARLKPLGERYFADQGNRVWGEVFICRHEGPFTLQAEEVADGEFMAVSDILGAQDKAFTPDGLEILRELRRLGLC